MSKRVMAACLTVLTLVVATGCSASNDGSGVASVAASGSASAAPTSTASLSVVEQGRRHARCMRAHGIPEADPRVGPHGRISIGGGYDKHLLDQTVLEKAVRMCRQYQPVLSGAIQRRKLAGALEYSRCMRAHGVKDFPDPDPTYFFQDLPASVQDEPRYLPVKQFCESTESQRSSRPSPAASRS